MKVHDSTLDPLDAPALAPARKIWSGRTFTLALIAMVVLTLGVAGLVRADQSGHHGATRAAPATGVVGAPAAAPPELVVNGHPSVRTLAARVGEPVLGAAALRADRHTHTVLGVDLVVATTGTPADVAALRPGSGAVVTRAAVDPKAPVAPPGLVVKRVGNYAVYALIHYTDASGQGDGWVAQPLADLTVR